MDFNTSKPEWIFVVGLEYKTNFLNLSLAGEFQLPLDSGCGGGGNSSDDATAKKPAMEFSGRVELKLPKSRITASASMKRFCPGGAVHVDDPGFAQLTHACLQGLWALETISCAVCWRSVLLSCVVCCVLRKKI